MINISKEDFGTLCICAIRYCQGRRTYMPSLVQDICIDHIQTLDDKTIRVMLEDCEFQKKVDAYGDPAIDKPGWLRWKDALVSEKERREETT